MSMIYEEKDVAEFIRLLKKEIKPHDCWDENFDWNISAVDLLRKIDKLAGDLK